MTVNEWAKDFRSFVNELQMPRDDYNGIMEYIDDALAMLKEQEAMEPIEEFRKGANCHVYHCKRCGNIVGTILGGKNPIAKLSIEHFCDVCGQAVKWTKS